MGHIDIKTPKQVKDLKVGDKIIGISRDASLYTLVFEISYKSKTEDFYVVTVSNTFEHIKTSVSCLENATSFYIEDFLIFLNKTEAIDYLEGKIIDIQDEITIINTLKVLN